MSLAEADLTYFQRGIVENPKFWRRLGSKPELKGLTTLDVGCGHGSLCVDMAMSGAQRVIGVDLDESRISFARENLAVNYPALEGVVDFRCCDVSEVPERDFDLVVSKDTFEHVVGLESCVGDIAGRMKPGGKLYVGFGPLYRSPRGDHRRTRAMVPWGHVLIPDRFLIARLNRSGAKVRGIEDLGLNGLSVREYRAIFQNSGLEIASFRVNASRHPISLVFSLFRSIPWLGEYFSHNLYCILRKPSTHC